MALHTKKVDGDGSDGQRLAVDPLLAGEVQSVPKHRMPDGSMSPGMAYRIVHDELMFDGNARLNLATFVTTHMDPEAERLMAETFDKNMIDKDEYPQTAELEMRCVNMLSRLWNSPDTDSATGCSTTGSSEAAMLGGLALKRRWQQRRRAAGESTERPNMVMGINVQICWEKFCNYFEVEPRYVPMEGNRFHLNGEEAVKLCDENTIGVVAVLGSTFDGSYEPVQEISDALDELQERTDLDVPIHVDGASGGMIAPFIDPDLVWDFRLPRVASINTSGHKYGRVYPGVGWAIWRDPEALPEDLVFRVNYLGGHAHVCAQLLAPRLADRGAVLQFLAARIRGLPARPAGVQGRRQLRGSRDRGARPLRAHNRRLGASRLRVQGPRRGRQLLGLRRLGRDARARLAGARVLVPRKQARPRRAQGSGQERLQ